MMLINSRVKRFAWTQALLTSALLVAGCSSVKMSGTPRSGTEQLMLTGTWDSALCTVDFSPLAGTQVFVDPQFVSVPDKDWVISSVRRSMAQQGVLLKHSKNEAQVIVEVALGAYGTEERECKVGLPQVGVIPTMFGFPSVSGGSSNAALNMSQTNQQDAVVKTALFAYDAKSGQMIWQSGTVLKAHGVRDHFVGGSGPYRTSSLAEVEEFPRESKRRLSRRFWRWLRR